MSGSQIERLRPEHVAGAAEAADHLVDDEQDVVFLQDRLHAVEVSRGRHDHAAGAHHRLGEERGDRIGSFAQDQLLEIRGEPRGERLLALTRLRAAIVVRAVGVQDARDRQVEIGVGEGEPGEASAGDGDTVVRALPRDDLLLLRSAQRIVDVPGELDRRVVRLGPRIREQHLGHPAGAMPINRSASSVLIAGTLPAKL